MKFNKVFLALIILIFVSSIGMAVAEDASIAGYSFTVPEYYTILNATDDLIVMQMDDYNVINFATGVQDDIEISKQTNIDNGWELINEDTIDYNDISINLQSFVKDGLYSYNYIVLSEQGNFVVTVVTNNADFDADLESEDNPAKIIFDSLEYTG